MTVTTRLNVYISSSLLSYFRPTFFLNFKILNKANNMYVSNYMTIKNEKNFNFRNKFSLLP